MSFVWTEEQFEEAKLVLGSHERVRDAAKEIGVSDDSLSNLFRRKSLRASDFLKKPDHEQTVPTGHRLRGNSTLLDEVGNVNKRWVKTERASDEPTAVEAVPPGHLIKKVSTLFDGQGQVRAQWIQAPKDEQNQWDAFWKACEKATEKYRGLAEPTPAPKKVYSEQMTLFPLGDPHCGLLAWHRESGVDFDMKIFERELIKVVDMLVDRSPPSRRAVLANLGDFFHIENEKQLTPAGGNKLDGDGRLGKIMEVGFSVMRRLVDRLLQKYELVEVVNLRGNHDPSLSLSLMFWLKAVFEREPRVKVLENFNPYAYIRHGNVLVGFVHGDGPKIEALPGIMAADRPEDWGQTEHRFWATGHVHHTQRKEFPGCVVESFRTLAASDAWHNAAGYRSGKSLSSITFDKRFGEESRAVVGLSHAQAVIRGEAR